MYTAGAVFADAALRLAHERLAEYRAEAGRFRMSGHGPQGPGLVDRIRAAVASVRSAMSEVDRGPSLPPLNDYPYRT